MESEHKFILIKVKYMYKSLNMCSAHSMRSSLHALNCIFFLKRHAGGKIYVEYSFECFYILNWILCKLTDSLGREFEICAWTFNFLKDFQDPVDVCLQIFFIKLAESFT